MGNCLDRSISDQENDSAEESINENNNDLNNNVVLSDNLNATQSNLSYSLRSNCYRRPPNHRSHLIENNSRSRSSRYNQITEPICLFVHPRQVVINATYIITLTHIQFHTHNPILDKTIGAIRHLTTTYRAHWDPLHRFTI